MSYLPLARKWRPQVLADVVGQEPVTTTLTNAITQERVAAAYLFAGPRGVGKTSTARIFAKCLNCEQGPTVTPCQTCDTCLAITAGNSLDVLEIDGASNRGIDQIRELREHVKYRPSHGQYKIYIIDEVHQITPDGFNALLKTLEEPPPHVRFVFATTHPEKVLPTILSRCQRFDFQRIALPAMTATLARIAASEAMQVEAAALSVVARAADGSLRDAESMLDQLWNFSDSTITERVVSDLLGLVERDALLEIIEAIVARDAATALQRVDALLGRGTDVTQVSAGLVEAARHVLVARSLMPAVAAETTGVDQPWQVLEQLIELPQEMLDGYVQRAKLATADEWLYMVQLLAHGHETIRRSQYGRIHLELVLIKIATRANFTALRMLLEGQPVASPVAATPVATPAAQEPAPSAQERPPHTPHPTVTIEDIQRDWGRVIEALGKQRMAVASCISVWKPLELVGDRLVLGVPDVALHRELLDVNGNKQLVEHTVAEFFHVPRMVVSVRPVEVAEVPPPTRPQREQHAADIVQSAIKMFNAKVVGHEAKQS